MGMMLGKEPVPRDTPSKRANKQTNTPPPVVSASAGSVPSAPWRLCSGCDSTVPDWVLWRGVRVGRGKREVSKLFAPASASHVSPSLAVAPLEPRRTAHPLCTHMHAAHRTAHTALHAPHCTPHNHTHRLSVTGTRFAFTPHYTHACVHNSPWPLGHNARSSFVSSSLFSFLFLFHFSLIIRHSPLTTHHSPPITQSSLLFSSHPASHFSPHLPRSHILSLSTDVGQSCCFTTTCNTTKQHNTTHCASPARARTHRPSTAPRSDRR